jgi:hypothetical protein
VASLLDEVVLLEVDEVLDELEEHPVRLAASRAPQVRTARSRLHLFMILFLLKIGMKPQGIE